MTSRPEPSTIQRGILSADLRWLAEIMWQSDPTVIVSIGKSGPLGTTSVERYAVIPSAERPRFLLPLESRSAARAALSSYNALRPPLTRWARAILAAGVGLRATERVFRDRLTVSVLADQAPSGLPSLLLREHLRQVLGNPELVLAIGMRPPGPYAKPVLQVFTRDGRPCGYVKVGWNSVTRRLVRAEADFLQAQRGRPFRTIVVPALLHRGNWRDLEISVASPLPAAIRRLPDPTRLPPLEATREIAEATGLVESPLAHSSYWHGLRRSLEAMLPADVEVARPIREHLRRVEERYGDTTLMFGGWHGDWTPWNIARLHGRIVVWDWEQAGRDVPLGFDVLHYLFQLPFAGRQSGLRDAVEIARRRSAVPLSAIGVPAGAHLPLLSAYLLELFVRYYGAQLAGAGVNHRFYPAILDLLATDLSR
jgi:hypothetical protein